MIGWQLTSDESRNTLRLCTGRAPIRPILEKTVVLLSGKVCEIIDENVKAPHICDWTATPYKFSHHK